MLRRGNMWISFYLTIEAQSGSWHVKRVPRRASQHAGDPQTASSMNRVRCRRGRCLLSQGPQLQLHVTVPYSAQQCTVQDSGTAPQPGKKRRRTQGQSSAYRQITRCVYAVRPPSTYRRALKRQREEDQVPPYRPRGLAS